MAISLNSEKLNDIRLSSSMSNSDQIVDYVEQVSANLVNKMNELKPEIDLSEYLSSKIDISGYNNIGTLNLSGNLEAGSEAKTIHPNTNAFGYHAIAGTKSFKIIGGTFSSGTFQVSADLNNWKERLDNLLSTYKSIPIGFQINSNYSNYSISAVDYDLSTFILDKPILLVGGEYGTKISNDVVISCTTDVINPNDSYARNLWLVGDYSYDTYDIGNYSLGTGAVATGYQTKAIQIASHTEGYATIAEGKYSHAEGNGSHAKFCGHAEGFDTKAFGERSHAECDHTTAEGGNSHAEGSYTKTTGINSHAEGSYTQANGTSSHAEGSSTQANGHRSHAEGDKTKTVGNNSHAEGSYTQAIGSTSHAEGLSCIAQGDRSHAEGSSTQANGSESHAEGSYTIANSYRSHAEGYYTQANGINSHAEGQSTKANKRNSHAAGISAVADHDYSFAWSGISTDAYVSKGKGTFNINPEGELNGFYIGGKSLYQHIIELINANK